MEKQCTKCLTVKSIELFEKRSKDKYGSRCKQCVNESRRKTPIKPKAKENYKICSKCNDEKHFSEFNHRMNSYHKKVLPFSYCKECERNNDSNRYEHICCECNKKYRSGRKDSKKCVECHREDMRNNIVMYKNKERDFKGDKNPMFGVHRFNEDNPNYKHGISETDRYKHRLISGYGIWRKEVYERDSYTCQCCNKESQGDIVAHHLDGYSWCEEKRVDVNNGVTLCDNCHNSFHKQYGRHNNTKEQFEEFKTRNMPIPR